MENVTMVNPGERKKFTQSRERVEPLLGKVCAKREIGICWGKKANGSGKGIQGPSTEFVNV